MINLYYNVINFFGMINRGIYWGWKLRKNYSYDCHSLYYIIHLKLFCIEEYFKTYGHCVWNSDENNKLMRKLKVAKNLAKRLDLDDYTTNRNKIEKKWGELRLDFLQNNKLELYHKNCKTEEEKEKVRKISYKASLLDEKQRQNEKEYLFKLLEKYIDVWWD